MTMRSRFFLPLLLALVFASCSQMPMVSPTILKISVPHNLSALLILLAEKENYFADAGLKVVLTVRQSPEDCFADLTSGKVDLALIDTPTWVYGDSPKVSILSEVYSTSRGMYLVVPQPKAKTLSGIKGRSLMFKPRSSQEWFINLLSLAEGLDLNQNSIVTDAAANASTKKQIQNFANVATDVELASIRNRNPLQELGVFSSRVHFEIYFVASMSNSSKEGADNMERFLTAVHRAEQILYVEPTSGDRLLMNFLPELTMEDVKALRAASIFRVGLSNTLYVLLTEQKKWVSTRYQNRTSTNMESVRALIRSDFLKKIAPGAVTLTEDLSGR